jgi:O-antigen ligase
LGSDAQAKYFSQSGSLGVLVGGRSEILVSSQAVIDSPMLGHGSWAKDFAYVDLLGDRLSSFGYEMGAGASDLGLIPAHSYIMQSWVWAGLLGGVFWLAILAIAVWLLANLYASRVELAPLLTFSTMLLLWNIAFSPYGSSARLLASYGIVLCLVGLRLVRGDVIADAPAGLSNGASRYPQPLSGGPARSRRTARNLQSAPEQPGNGI